MHVTYVPYIVLGNELRNYCVVLVFKYDCQKGNNAA